jgi:hypothetical protein
MDTKDPKKIGILLGVLYGISIRIVLDIEALKDYADLVSATFMFMVPFVIGFIRVHYELKVNPEISYRRMITISWQPIFIFLLVTVILLLEGSICIAMALPAFMFFSSLGGVFSGLTNRFISHRKDSTLLSLASLPLLLAPLELNFLDSSRTYKVENSIIIQASPEVVWSQLANVSTIDKNELPFSLTHFIGVPRPIEANMNASGVGAVRTSKWDKGVEFKEVITDWVPNHKMSYSFDIDPDSIPDDSLDKHVKLGGEYFSPIKGEYVITQDELGRTILHLNTTLLDNTNFGIYSRAWGEIIFQDFHTSLLKLMRSRAENIAMRSDLISRNEDEAIHRKL